MVQPRLTAPLTNLKINAAQDLRGILIRIGRFKSLEVHYTKVHLNPIRKLWENFDLRHQPSKTTSERNQVEKRTQDIQSSSPVVLFSSWLPSFYDELLLYLEQEWKWSMLDFPNDYKSLVPKLLIEAMVAIGASFVSCINLATGDVIPETKALAKGPEESFQVVKTNILPEAIAEVGLLCCACIHTNPEEAVSDFFMSKCMIVPFVVQRSSHCFLVSGFLNFYHFHEQ